MAIIKKGTNISWLGSLALACQLLGGLLGLTALPVSAAWAPQPEVIATHATWIYTPDAPAAGGTRHGLLLVLHGCSQEAVDLKDYGNLADAANRNGLVVALPEVGWDDQWGIEHFQFVRPKCWDYDRARDTQAHVKEMRELVTTLINREQLRIDPSHVYVVGLSSGGGLSLLLGCAAPDLFSGIGAIAGPSVGSDQTQAMADAKDIPAQNIDNAVRQCRSLATSHPACLQTQIANIAYGNMDRNGGQPGYQLFGLFSHAGQYEIVSVKWSRDNVRVLQNIYGIGGPGRSAAIAGAEAIEWPAPGPVRLAELRVFDVGHAWPSGRAGTGGGKWIAHTGLDYPGYITDWFVKHDLRRAGQPRCDAAPAAAGG